MIINYATYVGVSTSELQKTFGMIGPMSTKRRAPAGVGRPSKGDRHPFAVRIARDQAEQIKALADYCDVAYGDVIAEFVRMALEHDPVIRLPEPKTAHQQELSA